MAEDLSFSGENVAVVFLPTFSVLRTCTLVVVVFINEVLVLFDIFQDICNKSVSAGMHTASSAPLNVGFTMLNLCFVACRPL